MQKNTLPLAVTALLSLKAKYAITWSKLAMEDPRGNRGFNEVFADIFTSMPPGTSMRKDVDGKNWLVMIDAGVLTMHAESQKMLADAGIKLQNLDQDGFVREIGNISAIWASPPITEKDLLAAIEPIAVGDYSLPEDTAAINLIKAMAEIKVGSTFKKSTQPYTHSGMTQEEFHAGL